MKKSIRIASIVLALVILTALAGCSNNTQTQSASPVSEDSFELKLGFDTEHPPYTYINSSDEYTGFDLDLADALCKLKGWKLRLVPIDWTDKDTLINTDTIDCVWSSFTMNNRDDRYAFTDPYMQEDEIVVVNKDSDINSLADLAGKNVIVQADSSSLDAFMNGTRVNLRETFASLRVTASLDNAFEQLESGKVDALACDAPFANYYMSHDSAQFKKLNEPINKDRYAIGFSKEDSGLVEEVNEALRTLKNNGTIDKLCSKYSNFGLDKKNCLL